MKKFLSLTLAIILCLALLPTLAPHTAAAEEHYLEINSSNFPDAYFRNWITVYLPVSGDAESGYYMTQEQVESVQEITCSDRDVKSLRGIEFFPNLRYLDCEGNLLSSLDVSKNTALKDLNCGYNQLTSLDVRKNTALERLFCHSNGLNALDVSRNTALKHLECSHNHLKSLNISNNKALEILFCSDNQLTSLNVSANVKLVRLGVDGNHLATLNVSKLKELEMFSANGQTVENQKGVDRNGVYTYDLTKIMTKKKLSNVTISGEGITFNSSTGRVTFQQKVDRFTYQYNAGVDPNDGDIELPELPAARGSNTRDGEPRMMDVTVFLTFEPLPAFDGTVEWNASDVQFNGKTPYVIANGSAQTPRFTVKAKDGSVVDPSNYTYEYRENVNAGTAYVIVTFTDLYAGTAQGWFKIYLPATTETKVANTKDGIKITWAAVEGADGYVIYRRAWSSTTNGWTSFVRWNNTRDLNWTDTQVYAGTRYQYGIKAYFDRRVDPVSGAEIGGNVGDNYNLGVVGPLKTTVRITTRTLNSVTGGTKQITAKWGASKNFTGYQVQIATDAKFTQNRQTFTIKNAQTASYTVKNLKANTTYYVRVRSYTVFEGTTYYGGWSNVKNAKTN